MKKLILFSIALLIIGLSYSQTTVYIDPSGSTSGSVTGWDKVTIQSNTTYLQKKGTTYTVPSYAGAVISCNSLNNVIIGTYGTGLKPIIQDPNGKVDRLVDLRETQGFTIDGFDLIGAPGVNGTGVGIQMQGLSTSNQRPCKNIHILNCDIHSVGTGTWYIPYELPTNNCADDFQLVNCNLYNIQDDGVFWVEVKNIKVEGCHIYDVAKHVGNGGDGIHIVEKCENYSIKNNIIDRRGSVDKFCFISGCSAVCGTAWGTIEGNTFYSPDNDPNWGGAALYIGANKNCTIKYNKFIEGGQCAIHAIYNDEMTLNYNLFYNITGDGVIQSDTKLNICNNTIVSNQTGYYYLFSVGGDGQCNFWNNIVASNNLTLGGFHFAYGSWNQKNNLTQTNNPNAWNNYFGFTGNSDFHLKEGSRAINAGYSYTSYPFDLDGNTSPIGIIDVGCYEYGSAPPPPVVGCMDPDANNFDPLATQNCCCEYDTIPVGCDTVYVQIERKISDIQIFCDPKLVIYKDGILTIGKTPTPNPNPSPTPIRITTVKEVRVFTAPEKIKYLDNKMIIQK